MAYIVQEIQTTNGTPAFLPAEVYPTWTAAESAFYMKCGSAVASSIPVHTIMTYTENGYVVSELTKCFEHGNNDD